MPKIIKYIVAPRLPETLQRLSDIADNLWWAWNLDAVDLFFRMDRDLWTQVEHNPKRLLREISQERLEQLAESASFLAHLDRVATKLDAYMTEGEWRSRHSDAPEDLLVAYLSAEFGFHESITIYSGGLGVLAGDHLKAASDLGLPLVGLGLLYREGYFRQYLNADGWQQELYPKNDFYAMPIQAVRDAAGSHQVVEVPYPGRMVKAYLWKCQVGRVPLYLLDTDHEDNSPTDRSITGQLYGGDHDTRIKQEIMLGMGGVIALKALGLHPTTYHINEGHAAFMMLERIKDLIERDQITFNEAVEVVKVGSVFTTHTPVPAGNDVFDPAMINAYFRDYCAAAGISMDTLLALGRENPADSKEQFCMTILALKLSAASNGVSALHGEVARKMWAPVWKGVPEEELPITSITNGVHIPTWISRDLALLFDRYLGPDWLAMPHDQSVWERVDSIPDSELFQTHVRACQRLVDFARSRAEKQMLNRGASAAEVRTAGELLNGETLTIGFARRFATYKRATLLFKNPERLKKILTNPERPVQLIIAGKAHPQDSSSKELIRHIIHFSRDPQVRSHIVFIEDYDMNVARYMLQGVDCWLNTPLRPNEASGTSGMKAAANGALNISIPDGWWCEAEGLGENGWSIGKGEIYDSLEDQDTVESEALYEILEQDVVPMFYNRGRDNLPREWIGRMKNAIRTIAPMFNTYRMVLEYGDRFYIPNCRRRHRLFQNERKAVYDLAAWKQKVRTFWPQVQILDVANGNAENLYFGDTLEVTAKIHLGNLSEKDVKVEIYHGALKPDGALEAAAKERMVWVKALDGDVHLFKGRARCDRTGALGISVRVLPSHPDLIHEHETGLITWA